MKLIILIFLPVIVFGQGLAPIIYWTDQNDNTIRRCDYDGTDVQIIVSNGGLGISGIDIDPTSGRIYWLDKTDPAVYRSNLDGTNIETIVDGVGGGPHGIKLDLSNNRIYWTDRTEDDIYSSNLDGSDIQMIISNAGTGLSGIDLDIPNNKMYWADETIPIIRRADLDGTNIEVLVNPAGAAPFDIALDLNNSKIYITDRTDNNIRRCNLDGTNLEIIVSNAGGGPTGIVLDVNNNIMYWVDQTNSVLRSANLNGSNVQTIVNPAGITPEGLTIDLLNDIPLPVELTSFNAIGKDKKVILNWTTQSEINNLGFILKRSDSKEGEFKTIAHYLSEDALKGAGNTSQMTEYIYEDNNVFNNQTYWYKLVDVDFNGIQTAHDVISATPNKTVIDFEENFELPSIFKLYQNYPNPFNPSTNISFDIPQTEQELIRIKLEIHNLLGKKMVTLFNDFLFSGSYKLNWNGKDGFGNDVPAGLYVYTINTDFFTQSRKMLLLK